MTAEGSSSYAQGHGAQARVILRPTVAADLPHVVGELLPYRIRAITAVLVAAPVESGMVLAAHAPPVPAPGAAAASGKVIGIGGIAFPPDGTVWAFVQQSAEAKRYPVAFHRAGLAAMKMIRAAGLGEVRATADRGNETALRWLRRLGFVEAGSPISEDKVAFIWRGTPAHSGAAE